MKITINLIFFLLMTLTASSQNTFKTQQLKFERVRNAYEQKWPQLQKDLENAQLSEKFQLYIAAYKEEGTLELWLKSEAQTQFKLFKTYDFCAHSGTLGPKVIEGDGQTPEGFYKLNVFNPVSSYHLSLGVDYPNKVDLARTGKVNKPGSDIYIHGNCVTIGCIPLTDEKIKEVYIIAVEARNGGQQEIPIYIFPFRMTAAKVKKFTTQYPLHTGFWQTLQIGYQFLKREHTILDVKQDDGKYIIFPIPIIHDHGIK